ncbi:MAG: RHS repeat-associated core domain-containing protein [bacterium]
MKNSKKNNRTIPRAIDKYDAELGRFLLPDPLWEQYYAWSPYHYAAGNPVSLLDWDGREVIYNSDEDYNPQY